MNRSDSMNRTTVYTSAVSSSGHSEELSSEVIEMSSLMVSSVRLASSFTWFNESPSCVSSSSASRSEGLNRFKQQRKQSFLIIFHNFGRFNRFPRSCQIWWFFILSELIDGETDHKQISLTQYSCGFQDFSDPFLRPSSRIMSKISLQQLKIVKKVNKRALTSVPSFRLVFFFVSSLEGDSSPSSSPMLSPVDY